MSRPMFLRAVPFVAGCCRLAAFGVEPASYENPVHTSCTFCCLHVAGWLPLRLSRPRMRILFIRAVPSVACAVPSVARRLAAFEVEPASYAVALRAFKKIIPGISADDAYKMWRGNATNRIQVDWRLVHVFVSSYPGCGLHTFSWRPWSGNRRLCRAPTPTLAPHLQEFYARHNLAAPRRILDAGCGAGMSSQWLADKYPGAELTGLDLSPYFLAVAELEERCGKSVVDVLFAYGGGGGAGGEC